MQPQMWNGLYFLALFTGLCVAWDMSARRAAGFRRPVHGALVTDGMVLLPSLWLTVFAAYLATWSGWFASTIGWDRSYAAAPQYREQGCTQVVPAWR